MYNVRRIHDTTYITYIPSDTHTMEAHLGCYDDTPDVCSAITPLGTRSMQYIPR